MYSSWILIFATFSCCLIHMRKMARRRGIEQHKRIRSLYAKRILVL